jgi:hypothetical protein
MIIYSVGPIDNWYGWKSLRDVLAEAALNDPDGPPPLESILARLVDALRLAREVGYWEGDRAYGTFRSHVP